MKDLESLSTEDLIKFVKSFDHVFFDINGVLQHAQTTIPGGDMCIQNLRRLGKKLTVISNNSITAREYLLNGLSCFQVVDQEIVTSNEALLNYLKKIKFDKDIYVIGGQNLKKTLRQEGYNVLEIKPEMVEDSIVAIKNDCFETIKQCSNIGAVVVDVHLNFNLLHAHRAITLLNHYKNTILLCGAADDNALIAKGDVVLGPKFYFDAIKRLTKRDGLSYAKSSQLLADLLNKKYDIVEPKKVLFVGDDLAIDVQFGHETGYQTLLTFSGTTKKDVIKNWKDDSNIVKPDYYVTSLKDFNNLLVENCLE